MMDALFWYTGLVAWVLILSVCVSIVAADLHDRSVQRRAHDV
jgi:hypothetical protein